LASTSSNLDTREEAKEPTKEGEPIGIPRRSTPSAEKRRETSGEKKEEDKAVGSIEGHQSSHLPRLSSNPMAGAFDRRMAKALATSAIEPIKTPSSRYQVWRVSPGTEPAISCTMGWRARENRRGPRGSPCCTPHELEISEEPWKR
jgi:hypothetical protein